jgi:CubicO group peptidase (beta-lactamase class C family)
MARKLLLICFWQLVLQFQANAQNLYFPPLNNNLPWDSVSPASLGWCTPHIDSLYRFLNQEKTKAFIVLKDGKIVLEKYFGSFTADSLWYWASAGKTITAFLAGKAQEENFIKLSDTSAKHLGAGWTTCTPAQEGNIKVVHQLTMTTGLDDRVQPDNHCTDPACLKYLAPPTTRWAYHNAPYTMLEEVIVNATGQSYNSYTQTKLKNPTGITGLWIKVGYNNIYYSRPRDMARFGLLAQNNFIWRTDTLLRDTAFKRSMINSSQMLNPAYGYLWWLNGKGSFMLPGSQLVFSGSYAPDAPADMYAGIGKNGQIVSIAPSKGLVIVRMGENADQGEVPFTIVNKIWQHINYVMCTTPVSTTYIFTGNGLWTDASNWANGIVPPNYVGSGVVIVINPAAGGECILNVVQLLNNGATLQVAPGKNLRIPGVLSIQ